MKAERVVRVGVRRIQAGQEGLRKDLGGRDFRMDREVLVVAHHNLLVEAGRRLGAEEGRLRVVGILDREEAVQEDNRRIDREEDRQEEDSGLAVEEGNILHGEGRLEELLVEDVRTPAEGRESVLEEDSQPEALNFNVSIWL